jgi:hypothetical protein
MNATLEIYVLVDSDGNYSVGTDQDACQDKFEEDNGGHLPNRLIRIMLDTPLPEVTVLSGKVPPAATGDGSLTIQ